ncbi:MULTISPECIES: Cys-tRNA(Pro) deacylase [unclassified Bacillus (in: firmicutes)]|uniref:Cys-tRNA(Pro) deacylase n=1 Tax=unclassified Bacillus (in: firmicutes) TaxID=185979 RepID=UPI000A9F1721|nr:MULTISPECIES: Cys-tRNA(Pro) deacylase [unclassified Bacillus (in: firmicutes)]
MAAAKTNAMRILDAKKVKYDVMAYDNKDGKIDGVSVAEKVGKDPVQVYKTLVAQGSSKGIFVFVIPVAAELDLKKAAKVSGEKKIEMIPVKDIQKWTGYIRGGCSPVGMKKEFPTFLDASVENLESIVVSGGKIGIQIELAVGTFVDVVKANMEDLIKD